MLEVLNLNENNCADCYKCIRTCSVKAITYANNTAEIVHDECILCGNCFVACPQKAKQVRGDVPRVKEAIAAGKHVVCSLAPSFIADFRIRSLDVMTDALKRLGFAEVQETAVGAQLVSDEYARIMREGKQRVLISSCCPSINMLIQKYYPTMLPHLAKVLTPMQAHCKAIKEQNPEAFTVFIGPCIAKKAEADAAYRIQEEQQRKSIEITTAEANIAKQEKEILLKQKEAEVMEQSLDAQVRKKAEAERFARQQKADAELYERQREAEAKKYEQEQQAEAMKVQAEAEKFARAQEAEGIRAKGLAEAEAIRAKAVAEAEGIEKKAEAMTKMGKAAVLEMYFNALPDVVKNAAEPLTKVDKITMYGDGNSAKLTRDIMQTVTQVTDGLKESTGVDLQSVLSGFLGGKLADAAQPAPAAPSKHSRAPKQNAGTPAE